MPAARQVLQKHFKKDLNFFDLLQRTLAPTSLPWVQRLFQRGFRFLSSFYSDSPLVASAYGRRCVSLPPTPKIFAAARQKNLWYPGYGMSRYPRNYNAVVSSLKLKDQFLGFTQEDGIFLYFTFTYNHRQKQLGRLCNLTILCFNTQKREFFLLTNIPRPPYSMLGYNRTITPTNIYILPNIGPEAEGETKKEVKTATFPTLLTMIVVSGCFTGSCFKDFFLGFEVPRELAKFLW